MSAIFLATLVTVACGGTSSLSPSPVGPSAAVSGGGATISGTVSSSDLVTPRAFGTLNPSATQSITVTIVGTNVSTVVDGGGQFTLANVPTGTVQLNFNSGTSSATITISGVGPDDHVQIAVTLNGGGARIDSEHHSSQDNQGEFVGRITSIDSVAQSFMVSGTTVKVPAAASIRHGGQTMHFADLKVGDNVQVKGTKDGATITATEIKVESGNPGEGDDDNNDGNQGSSVVLTGNVSLLAGTCPAVTFTVQSTKVSTATATVFDHITCATLKNDAKVVVKGTKQTDGSVLATNVSFQESTVELTGTVSLLAGTCPAVTFTVQSTKVSSTTATVFDHITCATLKNDAKVVVKGTKQADGSVLATNVSFQDSTVELTGTVSLLAGTCPAITFTVQSTKVTSATATVFDHITCATLKNDAKVVVKGTKQADGSVLATSVSFQESTVELQGTVSLLAGTCPAVTFTVQSTKVTSATATVFDHTTCGALKNGTKVEVKGTKQADGSVLATTVSLDD